MLDRGLADLPAELDLDALALRREVEQAEVEVLDDDTDLFELVHRRGGLLVEQLQLGLGGIQVARRVAAAVAADRRYERALRLHELARPGSQRDEPLRGRADLSEGGVSLGRREEAIRHGAHEW